MRFLTVFVIPNVPDAELAVLVARLEASLPASTVVTQPLVGVPGVFDVTIYGHEPVAPAAA